VDIEEENMIFLESSNKEFRNDLRSSDPESFSKNHGNIKNEESNL